MPLHSKDSSRILIRNTGDSSQTVLRMPSFYLGLADGTEGNRTGMDEAYLDGVRWRPKEPWRRSHSFIDSFGSPCFTGKPTCQVKTLVNQISLHIGDHGDCERRRPFRGLYAITPEGLEKADLLRRAEAALRGGTSVVQYREKARARADQLRIAAELATLCRKFGAWFIVNDDPMLAKSVNADGVHLGASDAEVASARNLLGQDRLIGVSCYDNFSRATQAMAMGANYVAFGSVFASPTKPKAVRAPLELFTRCRQELGIPSCAIGGITVDSAPQLFSAGADLLAVITDLFGSDDVEKRARAFTRIYEDTGHDGP